MGPRAHVENPFPRSGSVLPCAAGTFAGGSTPLTYP